jgi:hypothetical protein
MNETNGPCSTRQHLPFAGTGHADTSADAAKEAFARYEQDYSSASQRRTLLCDAVAAVSPGSFWIPRCTCPSAWIEHASFVFWICDALRPRRFVELGTHYRYSCFAFCQAIDRLGLGTVAYAVDTWQDDEHAGLYDRARFSVGYSAELTEIMPPSPP